MSLTQNNRLVTIDTPLGKDAFVVRALTGVEAISELFSFELNLLSEKNSITADQILGKPVSISLNSSGTDNPRYFHGHVTHFQALDTVEGEKRQYVARVQPALWFTTLGGQNRIFENKDAAEIVGEVLADYNSVSLRKNLSATYQKRRYCVQLEETDFEFISRLLAEEGISYYFAHEKGSHQFYIVDKSSAYSSAISQSVTYTGSGSSPLENTIHSWVRSYGYHTASVEFRDYLPFSASEWHKKKLPEKTTNKALQGEKPLREFYGRFHFEKKEDNTDKLTESNTRQKASNSIKAMEGQFDTAEGGSTCGEFFAGGQFEMEHPVSTESGKYLLTRVSHRAIDGNDQQSGYSNLFTCSPADVYVPPSPENYRRVVNSPQVAKVVDVRAAGEQGSVDIYTQVKVQFPWKSEQDSCWLRVVQAYAGDKWGASFVPRVGQEVTVEYINGDPDRPIVTGALYNSDNNGPGYSRTQSGWKSQWEGSKFNEVRLDDKKGSEEVYIEAGKDWNVLVHNDNTETIENDQTVTVTNNRAITVTDGNETKDVSKGTQTTTVKGAITIESKTKITLKVGGSSIVLDAQGITMKGTMINSKSSANTKVEAGAMMDVKAGALLNIKGALVKIN